MRPANRASHSRRTSATVVVSPLVALQRDQVAALSEHDGAPAAAELNSSLGERAREQRLDALEHGELEYLLLAPEQLARPETLAELQEVPPSLLVVDEMTKLPDDVKVWIL